MSAHTTSTNELLMKSKALQIHLANRNSGAKDSISRFNHWWHKTARLVVTAKFEGKERKFLITSNN